MAVQIQLRNDTASNWTSANPTLARGELGIEVDTNKIKIGDGSTDWDSLPYTGINLDELLPYVSYTHNQISASNTWTITHGLGFYPAVTVFDSSTQEVEGAITHTNTNTVTIQFSASISGTAYLS